MLPLRLLFQLRGAVFMFIVLRFDKFPVFWTYFGPVRSSSRNTMDLVLPQIRSERSRKSVRYWGAKLWNSIQLIFAFHPHFMPVYETYLWIRINYCNDAYDLYTFV
jgi:hypothetical protein